MPTRDKSDRIKFREGKQREFLEDVAKSIGSLRGVARFLGIRWGNFWCYLDEQITLPYSIFKQLIQFSNFREEFIIEKWVEKLVLYTWGVKKGGIVASISNVTRLKTDREFREQWIEKCKKAGATFKGKFIENWNVGFRKAGKRDTIGPKGESMFNEAEKKIAVLLLSLNKNYEYERQINLKGKFYFPDFIVDNTIIERCGLCIDIYLNALKNKIEDYLNYWDGKIIIVCPKSIENQIKQLIPKNSKINLVTEDKLNELWPN